MSSRILPGRFVCTKCGGKFKLQFRPGVLGGDGPIGPLDNPCPKCGGPVEPNDNAARATSEAAEARGVALEAADLFLEE
jgi:hypothetical protein